MKRLIIRLALKRLREDMAKDSGFDKAQRLIDEMHRVLEAI